MRIKAFLHSAGLVSNSGEGLSVPSGSTVPATKIATERGVLVEAEADHDDDGGPEYSGLPYGPAHEVHVGTRLRKVERSDNRTSRRGRPHYNLQLRPSDATKISDHYSTVTAWLSRLRYYHSRLLWVRNMKIAQIAPLMESVPPRFYGGTERIVSYLTDELGRLGHEVTLFASADSVTAANLVSCASMGLRLDSNVRDPIPYYMLMLDRVRELADEFDILHFHIDQFHFPLFRQIADRTVDNSSWSARRSRPQVALSRLQRDAAGVDLQ